MTKFRNGRKAPVLHGTAFCNPEPGSLVSLAVHSPPFQVISYAVSRLLAPRDNVEEVCQNLSITFLKEARICVM
jgi:hypothetical protein